MNTIKKKSSVSIIKREGDGSSSSANKSTSIRLYTEFPQLEVSLDDFEEYGLHRLKVRFFCFCI